MARSDRSAKSGVSLSGIPLQLIMMRSVNQKFYSHESRFEVMADFDFVIST
jgi:hypothetical protein